MEQVDAPSHDTRCARASLVRAHAFLRDALDQTTRISREMPALGATSLHHDRHEDDHHEELHRR